MHVLLETLLFEVASFRSVTDEYVWSKPVGWLFSQYDLVQRAKWDRWVEGVAGMELAVVRGVAVTFSGSKKPARLPPLPTWSELQERKRETARVKPDWILRFEQANRMGPWRDGEDADDVDKDLLR